MYGYVQTEISPYRDIQADELLNSPKRRVCNGILVLLPLQIHIILQKQVLKKKSAKLSFLKNFMHFVENIRSHVVLTISANPLSLLKEIWIVH